MKTQTLKLATKAFFVSFIFLISNTLYSQSPGGVNANIQLWLKANDGVESGGNPAFHSQPVNTWLDKSGVRINNATDQMVNGYPSSSPNVNPPTFISSTAKNINYNQVVEFDGTDDGLDFGNDYIYSPGTGTQNGMTWLALLQPDETSNKPRQFVFDFGFLSTAGYGMIYSSYNYGMYTPTGFSGSSNLDVGHSFSTQPVLTNFTISFGTNQTFAVNGGSPLTTSPINSLSALIDANINQAPTHGTSSSQDFGPFTIGRQSKVNVLNSDNGRFFDGRIAELIGYSQVLSPADLKKAESYLGLKYAITLDNTSGGTNGDYVSSAGTTIWDASDNPAYHNQVIGIGRDDNSALNQKQSHQADDITRLYIFTRAANNTSNAGQFITDQQFIMMGNNGGQMKSTGSTEYPSGLNIYSRIDREWKVTKTAYPGTLIMDFKLNTLPLNANDLLFLVDDDGDFSNGGTVSFGNGTGVTISVSGSTVTVSVIGTGVLPISSTRYITLASTSSDTPLPIELADLIAIFKGDQLFVNWNTVSETNNDHFIIEASKDGKDFFEIGKIKSKANGGNSSLPISYTFSIATASTALMGITLFGLMGFFYKKRSKFYFLFVAIGIGATLYACTKSSAVSNLQNEDLFIRIVQVNKDSSKTFSKSVRAIR